MARPTETQIDEPRELERLQLKLGGLLPGDGIRRFDTLGTCRDRADTVVEGNGVSHLTYRMTRDSAAGQRRNETKTDVDPTPALGEWDRPVPVFVMVQA